MGLLKIFFILLTTASLLPAAEKPNFVLIFTDHQGYGDLGCFGSKTIRTPHLDRLAVEGGKFTSFLSASSVCTPSRAALLTGCYPKRVGFTSEVVSGCHSFWRNELLQLLSRWPPVSFDLAQCASQTRPKEILAFPEGFSELPPRTGRSSAW